MFGYSLVRTERLDDDAREVRLLRAELVRTEATADAHRQRADEWKAMALAYGERLLPVVLSRDPIEQPLSTVAADAKAAKAQAEVKS